MITVAQFAQHYQTLEPHKNPASLTFYNFIRYALPQAEEFKLDHIDIFYDRILSNHYWLSNKNNLGERLKKDLQSLSQKVPLALDFSQVVHACDMQTLTLDHPRDFASLLAKQVGKMEAAGEKIKTFRLPNEINSHQEVLLVRLLKDHSLVAEIRQNLVFIVDGELQLTRPHTRLIYDSELEFEYTAEQTIQISPMRFCQFRVSQSTPLKVRGHFIQFPHLQCTETFDREFRDTPELFHAVKKIERYFVNPITDPYFQQVFETINAGNYERQI